MAPFTSRSPLSIHFQLAGTRSYYHQRGVRWNESVVSTQAGRDSCPHHTDQPRGYYPTRTVLPGSSHGRSIIARMAWSSEGHQAHTTAFCFTQWQACSPTEKETKTFSCPLCSSVHSSLRKICKKCCPRFSVIFLLLPSPSIEKWLAMPQKSWALKSIFHFILFSSLLIFAFGSYFQLLFLSFFFSFPSLRNFEILILTQIQKHSLQGIFQTLWLFLHKK